MPNVDDECILVVMLLYRSSDEARVCLSPPGSNRRSIRRMAASSQTDVRKWGKEQDLGKLLYHCYDSAAELGNRLSCIPGSGFGLRNTNLHFWSLEVFPGVAHVLILGKVGDARMCQLQ